MVGRRFSITVTQHFFITQTTVTNNQKLTRAIAALLRFHGLSVSHARLVAHTICDAEARGIVSHGVRRLPNYLARLQAGAINATPNLRWHHTHRATATLLADHAVGQIATATACKRLITLTKRYGVAAIGIAQCEHIGTLDTTIRTIVSANLAGIVVVNTPVAMAPFGGQTALLGSNPIAIGIPGNTQPLLIFDGSTASVSRSKIVAAAEKGLEIPAHWAIDANGNATQNPQHALDGAILPAGVLGYGIGLGIALLTGAMIGGTSDDQLPSFFALPHQSVPTSVLMIGIDPDAFAGMAQLQRIGDALVSRIRTSHGAPRIPGDMRVVRQVSDETLDFVESLRKHSHG